MKAAKRHGTAVSYDLNYRPSLWKTNGGQTKAQEVNRELARYVDVMLGNEEDFSAGLGFEIEGLDENFSELPIDAFRTMINEVAKEFTNFKVIATTLRAVHSASDNDWSALAWSPSSGLVQAADRRHLEILDRVGGGDSFGGGLLYGLLQGMSNQQSIEFAVAASCLKHTIPGDFNLVSVAEVEALMKGDGSGRVQR